MESIYRQEERAKHRALGIFLVVAAWKAGADCVVLEWEDLRNYLGLVKIKDARVDWLCQDLAEWFPYSEKFYLHPNSSDNCLTSLWVSRKPVARFVSLERMESEERIRKMPKSAPRTVMLNALIPKRSSRGENSRRLRKEDWHMLEGILGQLFEYGRSEC